MSPSDKPDLARAWLSAQKLIDEEADRLATVSDEEFEREMSALPEPERIPTTQELREMRAKRAAGRASSAVQPKEKTVAKPSRVRFIAWLAAAAFGVLVAVLAIKRPESESRPAPQRAAALRDEAFIACRVAAWHACEDKLDRAKELDPAGEADPRVRAAREAIYAGLHPESGPAPNLK